MKDTGSAHKDFTGPLGETDKRKVWGKCSSGGHRDYRKGAPSPASCMGSEKAD